MFLRSPLWPSTNVNKRTILHPGETKSALFCAAVAETAGALLRSPKSGAAIIAEFKPGLAEFLCRCWLPLCVGISMSSVYDSSDGLWQYITQHSPPPEREEIAQIIGRSVINRNAVSTIFMFTFPSYLLMFHSSSGPSDRAKGAQRDRI